MTRPQTLRQAAASYRRRSSRTPALPHAELRRLERANELQERAEKLREAERKKKVNREKREKQLEKEREKRKREQTGGVRVEREVRTGGVKASQEVLGKFWGGAGKRNHDDAGEGQEGQEGQEGKEGHDEGQNHVRAVLGERSRNSVTPRRSPRLPLLSQHHLLPQSPSTPAKRRKLSPPISTSSCCRPTQPSSTAGSLKRKRECTPSPSCIPTPSIEPDVNDTIDIYEDEWMSLLPSNTQIEREISTPSSPPPVPHKIPTRSSHEEPSYLANGVASDQDTKATSTSPKMKEDIDPFCHSTHIVEPATTTPEQPPISTQDLLFSSADLSELLCTPPPLLAAYTSPPHPSPPPLNNPQPAGLKSHDTKQSDHKITQESSHSDLPKAEMTPHTRDSSRILASLSFSTLYSDDGPALSERELSLLLDEAVSKRRGVKADVSSLAQNT